MHMSDEGRVTTTRIVEALLIAGITAGVSVYAAVQVTQRDVQHLSVLLEDVAIELRELRKEMRPVYTLQELRRRVSTLESQVRDLERGPG